MPAAFFQDNSFYSVVNFACSFLSKASINTRPKTIFAAIIRLNKGVLYMPVRLKLFDANFDKIPGADAFQLAVAKA